MTPKQIEVYKRILAIESVQNMIRKDEQCDCGSGKKSVLSLDQRSDSDWSLCHIWDQFADDRNRRNKCCYPFNKGDLFKYLTTLIKISNHLALILPCKLFLFHALLMSCRLWYCLSAPSDTADQVRFNLTQYMLFLIAVTLVQTARHRELSRVAFGNESIPKYGPAMLVPRFCGKWMVCRCMLFCLVLVTEIFLIGAGGPVERLAERPI